MVKVESLSRLIDEHPFLRGIDDKTRKLLGGCAANETFEAGAFLLREGQPADRFFLIRAGAVAVEIHAPARAPIVIETLGDGDALGWSWLIEPHKWAFDARATHLTRVLSFDAQCLRRKMDEDPALGYEVLKRFMPVMAHRLAAARMQMLDIYGPASAKGARGA
ncbi:MAG: cyclic nucleotide-binding domain-containing protein [Rhodospirillales bacterium]|nr:cyclic nucleotide-binding domain-containing protein [Rhodospirillales bacterium]